MTTRPGRWLRGGGPVGHAVASNVVARVVALGALLVVSLVVARTAGPAGVGVLVMLRLLPWLTGLVTGLGLWGAAPYFLSGPGRSDRAYPTTFLAMSLGAGVVGCGLWVLVAPVLRAEFFPDLSQTLVLVAGVTVLTQMLETTAKACSQGSGDIAGSNRIIVLEELVFLPVFVVLVELGMATFPAMVVALVTGDLVTAGQGWARLARRGFFAGATRPTRRHVRDVAGYGLRAQLGSVALLLNARLDFALVGSLLGPAPLGVYAVASRYAELLRLPALALNYVLYPAYAREGATASGEVRTMLRRAAWVPVAAALPMALAAPLVLPLAYGDAFRSSVVPAWILLAGLAGGGVSGVVMAFLSASGRPGLGSSALGAGLVVTVVLDLALIPTFGVEGAAVASSVAYLTTAAVLLLLFRAVARGPAPVDDRGDRMDRRVAEVT